MGGAGLNAFGVVLGAFLQVAAGAEGTAGARDDGDESLRVAVKLGNDIGQFLPELTIDGIQSVGGG